MASPTLGNSASFASISAPVFRQDRFTVERKRFTFAPRFYFRDSAGNTLAFLPKKPLGWKDEIRLFTDETLSMQLLSIKASKITEQGTAFEVTDSINRQNVGTLNRIGWSWAIESEWTMIDANGQEIGRILERSILLRRFLGMLFPRRYVFEMGGQQIGISTQRSIFLLPRMEGDFSSDSGHLLDRRLAIAAVVLLMTIDEALG